MERIGNGLAEVLKNLSPELQQKIRDQEEHPTLPDWPENTRGIPNIYLRSALFGVITRGRRQAVKLIDIGTVKGVSIRYSGWQLDQGDLDVLAQLLHMYKYHRDISGRYIRFNARGFLRSIGRQPGKSGREWLKESIRRLKANALEITTELTLSYGSETVTYAGSLIDEFYYNRQEQCYFLKINPKLASLFNTGWTQIKWEQRLQLKIDLAKWLHGFYASHRDPFPVKVITLKHLCGSVSSRLSGFRGNLRTALDELVKVGSLESWKIDLEDKVHVQKQGMKVSQQAVTGGAYHMQARGTSCAMEGHIICRPGA